MNREIIIDMVGGKLDKNVEFSEDPISKNLGYNPVTTFWQDFTIADRYGDVEVKDTYKRAFAEWKEYVNYLTELSMVLNHKSWEHFRKENDKLATTYSELFLENHYYALEHLTGDDLSYYISVTD